MTTPLSLLSRRHLPYGAIRVHGTCTRTRLQFLRCHPHQNPHMGVALWRITLLLKPLRGSPQNLPELHGEMMVNMNGNPNPRIGERDRKHQKHVFGQSFVYPFVSLTNKFKLVSINKVMHVVCVMCHLQVSQMHTTRVRLYLTRVIIQPRSAHVLPTAWARATPDEGWRSCLL